MTLDWHSSFLDASVAIGTIHKSVSIKSTIYVYVYGIPIKTYGAIWVWRHHPDSMGIPIIKIRPVYFYIGNPCTWIDFIHIEMDKWLTRVKSQTVKWRNNAV